GFSNARRAPRTPRGLERSGASTFSVWTTAQVLTPALWFDLEPRVAEISAALGSVFRRQAVAHCFFWPLPCIFSIMSIMFMTPSSYTAKAIRMSAQAKQVYDNRSRRVPLNLPGSSSLHDQLAFDHVHPTGELVVGAGYGLHAARFERRVWFQS